MRELRRDLGLQLSDPPIPVFDNLAQAGTVGAPECAVIGNFDGVHIGHRALVQAARQWGRKVAAVTFCPHPAAFLKKYEYRPLLPPEIQAQKLAESGAGLLVRLAFDDHMARLEPQEFAYRLVSDLRVRHVVVGEDFRFGADRRGDIAFLSHFLAVHQVHLHVLPTVSIDGRAVHSRAIRDALSAGDVNTARLMLGEPYTLYGTVVRGYGRGRQLGFPTANIETRQWLPADGVYAAWAQTGTGVHPCAFSVGFRETFGRLPHCLEAYLIGFSGDLYDQGMAVRLEAFLRPQARFSSRAALTARMQEDVEAVRALLLGR